MQDTRLYGIRGAWCTQNTHEAICSDVSTMIKQLLKENDLDEENIVSIHFTVTTDLDVLNPAAALRKEGLCQNTALFCSVEPNIIGSLRSTVRVLITAYLCKKPIHIYGGGAEVLRPDFAKKG